MSKQLVLQLPSQWLEAEEGSTDIERIGDTPASWFLRDDDRSAGSLFYGDLKEAAVQAVGARVTVLVPGEDILLAQADLPVMKGQKLARAMPYALEEQLAEDVEDLHVAIGNRDAQGLVANAVVSRHTIESWLMRLRTAGLHPDVMSPELFGVTWNSDTESTSWSLIVNGARALLRTGAQTGVAFETENILPVLQASLDDAVDNPPSSLTIVNCSVEQGENQIQDYATQHEISDLCVERAVKLSVHQSSEDCGVLLAQDFDERNAINLLQGDYSRKQQLEKLFRPWRPAIILAAVWILLHIAMLVSDYSHLSSLAEEQQAEIQTIFQEALPGSRLVPGSEKELMERALEKLRGGSGNDSFLGLLSQAGKIIKDTDGSQIRSLRFKENKLDMDMDLPDLQALDKLKLRLQEEAKLGVEIISATSRNGKVESRLSLQGAPK